MASFFRSIPLLEIPRLIRWEKKQSTRLFYVLIVFMYMLIILKFACPSATREALKQFHLRSSSFVQWAIMQLVPSMYNFENQFWLYNLEGWVNHFPLRMLTFVHYRQEFFNMDEFGVVKIRSRYNNQALETLYMIELVDDALVIKNYDLAENISY